MLFDTCAAAQLSGSFPEAARAACPLLEHLELDQCDFNSSGSTAFDKQQRFPPPASSGAQQQPATLNPAPHGMAAAAGGASSAGLAPRQPPHEPYAALQQMEVCVEWATQNLLLCVCFPGEGAQDAWRTVPHEVVLALWHSVRSTFHVVSAAQISHVAPMLHVCCMLPLLECTTAQPRPAP
jgi:hypothetical protein